MMTSNSNDFETLKKCNSIYDGRRLYQYKEIEFFKMF